MEPLNSVSAILRRASMVLSVLIMLAVTIWLVAIWPTVPESVPTHFGADGSPSAYGGKSSLLSQLIAGWTVVILFIVMEFFPQLWNIPGKSNGFRVSVGKVTAKNNGARATAAAITSMRSLMAVDRVMIALLFALLTFCSARCQSLPVWAMIMILVILFGFSAFFTVQASRRNKQ